MNKNILGAVFFLGAALMGVPSGAGAQVLAVATLEGTYQQLVNSSSWQEIYVKQGGTSLQFTTDADNERVVITYSASCAALGFIVYVRAKVDGVAASPGAAGGVDLCYISVSGSTFPASRTFSALISAKGAHSVTIEAKAGGSGAAILIGNSALVVQH